MLSGGGADDALYGAAGKDTLVGGAGADLLSGGAGVDTFVFFGGDLEADPALTDVIADFSQAGGDKLRFSGMDADTATAGVQAFSFIGDGAFTGQAGELHYVLSGGGTIVEGDLDGDGIADFSLRLAGAINLTSGDFLL